jgi:hypothetical protein
MKKNKTSSIANDFQTFLGTEAEIDLTDKVPDALQGPLLEEIHQDLNPSALRVFRKTSLIYFLSGAATLMVCPQFGLSLTSGHGVMHYLMQFGDTVCMLGCGALFAGLSFFSVSAFLRPEEIRVLKKNRLLSHGALAALSLGAFICLGAEVVIGLGLFWFMGAIFGGLATFELGWLWKKLSFQGRTV